MSHETSAKWQTDWWHAEPRGNEPQPKHLISEVHRKLIFQSKDQHPSILTVFPHRLPDAYAVHREPSRSIGSSQYSSSERSFSLHKPGNSKTSLHAWQVHNLLERRFDSTQGMPRRSRTCFMSTQLPNFPEWDIFHRDGRNTGAIKEMEIGNLDLRFSELLLGSERGPSRVRSSHNFTDVHNRSLPRPPPPQLRTTAAQTISVVALHLFARNRSLHCDFGHSRFLGLSKGESLWLDWVEKFGTKRDTKPSKGLFYFLVVIKVTFRSFCNIECWCWIWCCRDLALIFSPPPS